MTKGSTVAKRINARLDADAVKKLAYLAKRQGQSVSEVLRLALRHYYDEARANEASSYEIFERVGLIGCGRSGNRRSADHKEEMLEYLERKHGYR
jgi:hypothetical protein